MSPTKRSKKFFQLLSPIWYLDALLFWSVFTSSTIFMFGLLTNNAKDELRYIVNRDLETFIIRSTQSLHLTQLNTSALTLSEQKEQITQELHTILQTYPNLLGAYLYSISDENQLTPLTFSKRPVVDSKLSKNFNDSITSKEYQQLIQHAATSRMLTTSAWAFLKSYRYQLVTPKSDPIEYIVQPFYSSERSFIGTSPILVFAFDANRIRQPFKNIDLTNGQVIGISILLATILSLLVRRRSMQREDAIKEKLAALSLLKQRDTILATLAQTGDRLLNQKDISTLLNRMLNKIGDVLPTKNCYAILHPPQLEFSLKETSNIQLGTPVEDPIIPNIHTLNSSPWDTYYQNLQQGYPLILSNVKAAPAIYKELKKRHIESLFILPIFINEHLNGLLVLEDHEHLRDWEPGVIDCLRLATELIGTAYDYEQNERALRQSSKMEALGRMAGGVAHEFNNLLHIITGNLRRLSRSYTKDSKNSDEIELVHSVLEVAQRGERIVEQLLKATRQHTANLRAGNLNDIVNRTLVLAKPVIKSSIKLEYHLAKSLPACYLDEGQINQVILNLILNANDAIHEDGIITIKTGINQQEDADGNYKSFVFCEVKDNGSGIDPKLKDSIFDPFVTSKDPGKGTGLGLSTCKGILSSHSGFINASDATPHGAIFTIAIPEATFSEDNTIKSTETSPIRKPSGTTAIIADDEALCLDVLVDNLEDSGFCIFSASDGTQAIDLAKKHGLVTDWIITDWTMPGPPGHKLVAELRKFAPTAHIIVTSGYILQDEENSNIDAVIKKPFNPDQLLGTMQRLQIENERKGISKKKS